MTPAKKTSAKTHLTGSALRSTQFLKELAALKVLSKTDNSKFFNGEDKTNKFLNIRMSDIFGLAKQYSSMSLNEIALLLESIYYEARMGAVSIMDFQARDKKNFRIKKTGTFQTLHQTAQ